MSLTDAQIAGICVPRGHELATRNVDHFSTTAALSLMTPPSGCPIWAEPGAHSGRIGGEETHLH